MERVFIRRAPNTTGLPDEYVEKGKMKVGGCALGESPLTGLTDEEIQAYMPRILGINATANEFMERVNTYFDNIEFNVPSGTGLQLDVSMTDKTVKVGSVEVPIPTKPRDYIRYKYCQVYPDCANSEEIVQGGGYKFFIFDEGVKLNKEYNALKERRTAQMKYLEVSSDMDTVNMILTLLGDMPSEMSEGAKMIALETAANTVPARFTKIASDKNLPLKAKIQAMVSRGIIQRVGNAYVYQNETIGNHSEADPYKELVIYLKNPVNSETYIRLFAQLGEEPLELNKKAVTTEA